MAKKYSRDGLYRIAVAQKVICVVILVQLLSGALQVLLTPEIVFLGTLLYFGVSLVGLIFIVVFFIRIYGAVLGIFLALFALIPLLGLLILLAANSRATAALKEAGFKVGLLGTNLKEVKETPLEELTNVFE